MLYGEQAQEKIESASVMICGVGAVGSFVAEALARVGIGKFILVDCDVVELSNINRQLCALHSTLGKSKTSVMRDRILDINPRAQVEVFDEFIDAENVEKFVGLSPNIIVDAIDSISSKVELIATALSKGVEIVSSMGAARKTDASLVEVAELFKTKNCPLAARIRKEMRGRGFKKAQMCVYSTELVTESSRVENSDGKKVIGSTPVVTGVFGLLLAQLALESIIK